MRSVNVVFPESICAETPMFRWNFKRFRSLEESWYVGYVGPGSASSTFFKATAAEAARLPENDNATELDRVKTEDLRMVRRHDRDASQASIGIPFPEQCRTSKGIRNVFR